MARLKWDQPGTRYFETGVDQGVLYVQNEVGVAWPGLISVSESPVGGEPRPFYLDGIKYLNLLSAEEYEATIEAFSYPTEFTRCNGVEQIHQGLFATQQQRIPFSMSYRTLVGNDTQGLKHGYKIHIVYGLLAAPSARASKTTGDRVDADPYSWRVSSLPPNVSGRRPTTHFVIDSRHAPPSKLSEVLDILYGTDTITPRLPSAEELILLFA